MAALVTAATVPARATPPDAVSGSRVVSVTFVAHDPARKTGVVAAHGQRRESALAGAFVHRESILALALPSVDSPAVRPTPTTAIGRELDLTLRMSSVLDGTAGGAPDEPRAAPEDARGSLASRMDDFSAVAAARPDTSDGYALRAVCAIAGCRLDLPPLVRVPVRQQTAERFDQTIWSSLMGTGVGVIASQGTLFLTAPSFVASARVGASMMPSGKRLIAITGRW